VYDRRAAAEEADRFGHRLDAPVAEERRRPAVSSSNQTPLSAR
jgi:hypothetical protein